MVWISSDMTEHLLSVLFCPWMPLPSLSIPMQVPRCVREEVSDMWHSSHLSHTETFSFSKARQLQVFQSRSNRKYRLKFQFHNKNTGGGAAIAFDDELDDTNRYLYPLSLLNSVLHHCYITCLTNPFTAHCTAQSLHCVSVEDVHEMGRKTRWAILTKQLVML